MSVWRPALVLLLLVTLASSRSPADDTTAWLDTIRTLTSAEMDGRGPGTPGIDRARDWLVERFTQTGLAPAFGDTYVQPFEAQLGVEATRAALAANGQAATHDTHYTVLGFSASKAFEGEAVFVGYGIAAPDRDYDSFAGLGDDGLRGKVAIAFRYEPMDAEGDSRWAKGTEWTDAASLPNKAAWAAQRGAAALLVVNPPTLDDVARLRPTATTAFGDTAAIPVMHVSSQWLGRALQLAGIGDAQAFFRETQARANAGKDRPLPLPGLTLRGEAAVQRRTVTLHNVAAVLPGRGDLADQWVVVGAHYDHLGYGDVGSLSGTRELHPGADDNASGVAAVLLLAQRLASAPGDHARRSLLFVLFSGEERGLLGATHFTRHLGDAKLDAQRITAMVNLDMVGRLRDNKLHVFGVATGEGLKALVQDTARDHALQLTTSGSGLGMSDHTAFYFRKVPALHLFTGIHEDYHRPTDTADRITPESIHVVDFAQTLVSELASRAQPLRFVAAPDEDEHAHGFRDHGGGPRAVLGIMPDYATLEGDRGCGITGVSPGSAADAAGLVAGDLIIRWNDKPIANVRDLTARLGTAKPGQTVTLTVQRGNDQLSVTVTLGQR